MVPGGSESLFLDCGTCGEKVAKSAKSCPKCGAKIKKLSFIHWVGIVFFSSIIVFIALISATYDRDSSIDQSSAQVSGSSGGQSAQNLIKVTQPHDEVEFIKAISQYTSKFSSAKNELQQSAVRDQRKLAIAQSLSGYSITSWTGIIRSLETNAEGKGVVAVGISPNIRVKTWNNALSDIFTNTSLVRNLLMTIQIFVCRR